MLANSDIGEKVLSEDKATRYSWRLLGMMTFQQRESNEENFTNQGCVKPNGPTVRTPITPPPTHRVTSLWPQDHGPRWGFANVHQ